MGWEKFESRMRIKRASNSNYSTSSHTIKIFFDFLFQSCITFNFCFKACKVKCLNSSRHAWQIFDHSFYYLRRTCKEMNNCQGKTTKSWQTNQLQPFQPFDKIVWKTHPWNFTQSSGCYHNSLLVYNICRKQSRFSCVSTIYFFVGALMWITASLDLHVCKELMDLPPFRRPRNTQTIWNIPSRKKNVFEKPQFWKKNEVKNWIHSW